MSEGDGTEARPPIRPKETSAFMLADYAIALLHKGHHPVRLELGLKRPGHRGWQNHVPTEESLRRDFSRPSNIGILQGIRREDGSFPIAYDVDLDDHPLICAVSSAIGVEVPQKRGKKGVTFFARSMDVESGVIHDYSDGKKKPAIDVLAGGKQTVIPPSLHPDTGLPYQWKFTPLTKVDYSELPIVTWSTTDEIKAFCKDRDNPISRLNDMTWKGDGGGGDTHDTCVVAVALMVNRDWPDEAIHQRIQRAKREACETAGEPYNWPKAHNVIQEWILSARGKGFDKKKTKGRPSHGVIADRILERHHAVARYDRDKAWWYYHNGVFWEPQAEHFVRHLIDEFLIDDYRDRSIIDGVERSMRDRPLVSIRSRDWDPDKHFLNTPDGTYDLTNGEKLPHDSKHLITRVIRASPSWERTSSRWMSALPDWFSTEEEQNYIQALAGYFLTGETRHPVVGLWLGQGGDGKSVIANAIAYAMGDYAQTATDSAFVETRFAAHNEELARLNRARFVQVPEVTGTLHLTRIKAVSGGEDITASYKGKHLFEFTPEFKLLLIGNEPPSTRSVGREMQRRFHVRDFKKILDPDVTLAKCLQDEAGIILGWAIDGAQRYYKSGIQRSTFVQECTHRYFADYDFVQQFIEDSCDVSPDYRSKAAELYGVFKDWCELAGMRNIPHRAEFARRLVAKGFEYKTCVVTSGQAPERGFTGIRHRSPIY